MAGTGVSSALCNEWLIMGQRFMFLGAMIMTVERLCD